jgi:hypothetical protein
LKFDVHVDIALPVAEKPPIPSPPITECIALAVTVSDL